MIQSVATNSFIFHYLYHLITICTLYYCHTRCLCHHHHHHQPFTVHCWTQASLNPFRDSCVCHGWLRGLWRYNPVPQSFWYSVPQSFRWDVRFVPPYSEYSVEPYISIRRPRVYAVKDGTPYIYETFPICQKGTSQALGSCSGFAIRVSLLLG